MITMDRVRTLAAHQGASVVTSCYLDVDGRRYPRPLDYETQLDALIREARKRAKGLGREQERSVSDDLKRIESWVRGGFDRSGVRGLAFFACAADGLFEVIPLPHPARNHLALNHSPHVRQLEAMLDEHERFALVLVDRERARLFRFQLGVLTEQTEFFDKVPRGQDQGELSAQSVQRHTDELVHRHLKHVADVVFESCQASAVDRVSLGGPLEIVTEFQEILHPYVRGLLGPRVSVSVGSSVRDIRQAAMEAEYEAEREGERRIMEKFRDALGSGNGGVAGLEPTLAALAERRVDVLLVSDGYEAPGWRCLSCRYVAAKGRECPLCSASMELVDDVIEEAVEDALANRCKVEVVMGNADLDVLGRVGALLRF